MDGVISCELSARTARGLPAASSSPAVETLVWAHVIGRPTEKVQLSADVTMNQKLDEEREPFSRLSIEEMEEVAAESEALVAKVRTMAQWHVPPAGATLPDTSTDNRESTTGESAETPGTGGVDDASRRFGTTAAAWTPRVTHEEARWQKLTGAL